MNLKKNLKRGQASVEYLVLFAVIAVLTLMTISPFFTNVSNTLGALFQRATGRIVANPVVHTGYATHNWGGGE